MCGGPLCTRLSARNVLGEKKKHGFGVGEEQEVLELFTIVFLFFSFCTMQRSNILRDSAFPKAPVCACGRGGRTNIQHQTASFPTWEHFRRNRRASAGTPRRRPPRSILNTTNKNAASKQPRRRHHRFQQGTLPSTHTPINKKKRKIATLGSVSVDVTNAMCTNILSAICAWKSISSGGSKGKRAQACQK